MLYSLLAYNKVKIGTFDISYEKALLYFLSISVSFFITLSVLICYLLYPKSFWYLAAVTPLALNRVLEVSTPPSILASSVLVFLLLFTFYLFQNKEKIITEIKANFTPPALFILLYI
jgi:hypothetical protein